MMKVFSVGFMFCMAIVPAGTLLAEDGLVTDLPLVFSEDFEDGRDRWELTDDKAWTLRKVDGNNVFGLNKRTSDYKPEFRSPHNIALIKNLELTDFVITFKVKSTKDTGNHRDCCVFFCHKDATHFYYCHLGAVPDPHSGQIMIVKNAPRLALTKNKTKIEIKSDYYLEIEKIVGQSNQFQTVSEYVNFVLKEMLFGFTDSGRTESEEDLIKKRLQGLGYV